MLKYKLNSKGQTGETISWVIATLVIVGILILFVYLSVLMSKTKIVNIGTLQTDLEKDSKILSGKTTLAEMLNDKNKEMINEILKES